MALQDTDLLVVNRGGTNYKVTVADFKTEITSMKGLAFTSNYNYVAPNTSVTIPQPSGTTNLMIAGSFPSGAVSPNPAAGTSAGSNWTVYYVSNTSITVQINPTGAGASLSQGGTLTAMY